MKKLQNYLMRPQELRKKLQNPKFRKDFLEWSKSNASLHRENSRHSRSKSPVQRIQRSLQLNSKKQLGSNKENIRPQSTLRQHSQNKGHSKSVSKPLSQDRRNDFQAKRTSSGSLWSKNNLEKQKHNYQSLNNKNRYNSCSSIEYHKKQKGQASMTEDKKKIKQRYSYRTKQGVQITNPGKVNQDSLVIKTNLAEKGIHLYAVADGHGAFGHFVSQFIVKNISKLYQNQLKTSQLTPSIPKVYQKLQQNLSDSDINASCSGSTLVNVMIEGDEVVCANVGDSRAILARQIDRKSWELIYLSQDHKPSVQSEKKRIIKSGGRVHAFRDEHGQSVGPQRVWLPNQNIQGLAMSRSFGDNVSKLVGVTSEPQVIRMRLDKRDKFILLASDGVWQFVSNQQVLQLLVPYYKEGKLEEACDALLKLSYDRWTVEDNSVVDDITFVLIFLQ